MLHRLLFKEIEFVNFHCHGGLLEDHFCVVSHISSGCCLSPYELEFPELAVLWIFCMAVSKQNQNQRTKVTKFPHVTWLLQSVRRLDSTVSTSLSAGNDHLTITFAEKVLIQ